MYYLAAIQDRKNTQRPQIYYIMGHTFYYNMDRYFFFNKNILKLVVQVLISICLFQLGSGADLAILYVDVLIQSDTPVLEEIFERIAKLFAAIGPTIPERDTFLTNAIKWSQQNNKRGHAKLHQVS